MSADDSVLFIGHDEAQRILDYHRRMKVVDRMMWIGITLVVATTTISLTSSAVAAFYVLGIVGIVVLISTIVLLVRAVNRR